MKYYIILACILASGCTHTKVIPQGAQTFTIQTTAASKVVAYNTALTKAQSICGHKKRVVITENSLIYRGITPEQRQLIVTAHTMMPQSKKAKDLAAAPDDYKVTITWHCD